MIQILLTKNKYYKKKYLLSVQFVISIIIVFVIIYFICNYFYKIKQQEKISKQLTNNYNLSHLYSDIKSNSIEQQTRLDVNENLFGTIEISKIQINYPIFPNLTEEFLKIGPCKFYGEDLNKNGNICIAGHNYDNGKFFSNIVLLDAGDDIYIYSKNTKYTYTVVSKYEVNVNDLTPIFDYDYNRKCLTLVTCNNLNGNRIIVKALQN